MNYKTHVIGGLSAGVFTNEWFASYTTSSGDSSTQLLMTGIFVAGSVVGSLIPDIDHRGSYLGRRMRIISTPLSVAGEVSKQVKKASNKVRGKKGTANTIISHRGITHTPLLLMVIVSLLLFISHSFLSGDANLLFNYLSISIGIGIASHILLDSFTKGGVPLLYPFTNKKFSFLPIKTGGFLEILIASAIAIGTLLFITGKYFT